MRGTTFHSVRKPFSTISRLSMATVSLLILIVAFSVSASLIKTRLHKPEIAINTQPSKTSQTLCCRQDMDQPHFLAASYYRVGNNLTATLMLNNKGPQAIEVRPTLFSFSGERLETPPVIVRRVIPQL